MNAVADMDGDAEGWQIGGDLWLRYPLSGGLSLSFLLSVGYQDLNLDGDGKWTGVSTGLWKMDKSRRDWFIGAGFSVLFDL